MNKAFVVVLIAGGLALSGACATDQVEGCQKDTDCAEDRICEAGACTWASGGSSGTGCVETGQTCSVNRDCCNFQGDQGFCVSGTCADACTVNADCQSGCCAPLVSGERACAPASICQQACVDTGESCSINADCCNFRDGMGFCVDGICADTCDGASPDGWSEECVSGCCAALDGGDFACAPFELCL